MRKSLLVVPFVYAFFIFVLNYRGADKPVVERKHFETLVERSTSLKSEAPPASKPLHPTALENLSHRDETDHLALKKVNENNPAEAFKSLVLTSVYSYKKDPQRSHKIKCDFNYISNFYNSVAFHGLNSVILHDCFDETFVRKHTLAKIKFLRVNTHTHLSTNDFRFVQYKSFLKNNHYDYYMFVDASDVFFNANPFEYMHNHKHGHTLFMSPDIGQFHKNAWQVRKCYKKAGELWDQNVQLHNAGVWGGDYTTSKCILDCMVNQFETTVKGRGNCNMPVLNWCVHLGGCTNENTVEDKPDFVNPFRKECRHPHLVIHNKCRDTEGKTCLVKQGNKLVLRDRKGSRCKLLKNVVSVGREFEDRDDISMSMSGKAVEIGIYNGDFAEKNLRHFKGDYYMVDIAVRKELQTRLNSWRNEPHIHFLNMKSIEAADTFKDESLDWVYIDARHDYNSVLEDMNAWWPKLKQGGMFSGHDYCASKKDRRKYPHLPWCGIYQNTPKDAYRAGTEKASQLDSARAVMRFGQEHRLNIMHTWEGRESLDSAGTSRNPSWYVFKPLVLSKGATLPSGNAFDDTSKFKVHICLAADKSHDVGISALIRSLKKNTKSPDDVIFHKFSLDSEYSLEDVQPYINSNFSATDRGNLKVPANYVRFILAQKLPQVDACWWIDADVIVQGDIVKYTKNIRLNKLVAAFPRDSSHLSDKVYSIMKKKGLTVSSSKKGFNAGIIYLNLALWRERNIDTTIRKICAANSKYSLWSKFGSQPPLQLVAGDDMVYMDTKNYADGLGWRKGLTISPKTMFLHWNGKHKPWLTDGWYKDIWEPYSPKGDTLPSGNTFDAVLVSGSVTCVLELVIKKLKAHLLDIGNIHVIVLPNLMEKCNRIDGIHCHDENTILQRIDMKLNIRNKNGWMADRTRISWYYQQFLKLFAYQSITLSERFLIWDADNMLLKSYSPIKGEKTRFAIGGWENNPYPVTSKALTGLTSNRNDIVVHQMLFDREILNALMVHLCGTSRKESCANIIIDNIPERANSRLGFSEYHLYYTWFSSKEPELVFMDPKIKFERTDPIKKRSGTQKDCTLVEQKYAENVYMMVLETKSEQIIPHQTKIRAERNKVHNLFKTRTSVPECKKPKVLPDTSTSKMICLDNIIPGSCVVYSFGINYQWDFDDYMHEYGCVVYSFDPGMNYKSKRAERHFFEKIGIGAKTGIHTGPSTLYSGKKNYNVETIDSIMNRLGHSKIDLLRLDTEGAEFEVLSSLPFDKIGQFSVEIHMWSHSFDEWKSKLMNIPLQHLQTYQNTDRINKKTMQEVAPGITRVYEMTFMKK